MVQIKAHLKKLYRAGQGEKSRMNCLRLDMNESVSGLPEDFVKEALREVSPGFLAKYPEYEKVFKNWVETEGW